MKVATEVIKIYKER